MSVLTDRVAANGKGPGTTPLRPKAPASPPVVRRRQVPWIVAGVVLVVGCALAFGLASIRVAGGEQVLAVARAVPAGQVLQAGDLRVVRVSPTSGLQPVLAGAEASMVGRPAAVALLPGTLLTAADVGAGPGAAGTDIVAMALKAGAFPPSLGAGAQVEVVPVAAGSSGPAATPLAGPGAPVQAVVIGVEAAPTGSSADAVVTLQVDPSAAAEVAQLAAAGQAVLVQLPAGGSGAGQ